MAFQEKQLCQARENSTNAVSVYSPGTGVTAIIKEIWLVNTTSASVVVSLFCDDDGTTYDENTALIYQKTFEANEERKIPCFIAMNNTLGNLAYQVSVANAVTLTAFGAEQT